MCYKNLILDFNEGLYDDSTKIFPTDIAMATLEKLDIEQTK